MLKCSVYIAISLDGYIAREDGSIDWLESVESPGEGEDYGYEAFFNSIDVMLMGRKTMEKVRFFGVWPYKEKNTFIFSRTLKQLPTEISDQAQLYSGEIQPLVNDLSVQGFKHAYVDGGALIRSFLRLKLIDQLIITRIPVLLGRGISLFENLNKESSLKLINQKAYSNGLTQHVYTIIK